MKRISLFVVSVLALGGPALAERPTLDGREAPRATDLLRAEKLADQARRRLETPRSSAREGWLHGGSGWGENERADPAARGNVVINVRPATRRRKAPALD
jgi:hypothetical protein